MPLYEYRCTQCGHRFERIQSFNSEPVTECPQCNGSVERPLTAPALQFKGAGWYITDYASKGGKASSSADSAQSKSESATESKPAAPSADSKPAASDSGSGSSSGSKPSAPAASA